MTLSELLRAKVIVKLDLLAQEQEMLEAELREKRSFHTAAWAEYGSELCGGGMQKSEQEIADKIEVIKHTRDLLLEYKDGKHEVSHERQETLRDIIGGIDQEIERQQWLRRTTEEEIAKIDLIRSLIV